MPLKRMGQVLNVHMFSNFMLVPFMLSNIIKIIVELSFMTFKFKTFFFYRLDKKTKELVNSENSCRMFESRVQDLNGKYNNAIGDRKKAQDEAAVIISFQLTSIDDVNI